MDKVAEAIGKAVEKIQTTIENAIKIEKDIFVSRPGFYLGGISSDFTEGVEAQVSRNVCFFPQERLSKSTRSYSWNALSIPSKTLTSW